MKIGKGAVAIESMSSKRGRKGIVPVALGTAMLAVVLAAALSPNVGIISAQANAQYNQPAASSGTSIYVYLGILALIIVAALVAALLLVRRRRRPPAASNPPPVEAWKGGPGAGTPPSGASTPPSPPTTAPAYAETAADVEHGGTTGATDYLETPADVGHSGLAAPAAVGAAGGAAAGAGAAKGAAGGEPEPDIDSLMTELDKISGEIMKRSTKKSPAPPED